jgi:hypothetical protein
MLSYPDYSRRKHEGKEPLWQTRKIRSIVDYVASGGSTAAKLYRESSTATYHARV